MAKLKQLYQSEQRARQSAEQTADRLARLQALTAALSQAVTTEQVAEVILTRGLIALEANVGVVAVLSDDRGEFTNLRIVGYPQEIRTTWRCFAADSPLPMVDAVREHKPVILESLEQRNARYPDLGCIEGGGETGALVALPLIHGQVVGGMEVRFAAARAFHEADLVFLQTLSGLCAQALERARLYDAERRARENFELEARVRQRAEAALRDSEERYRRIVETSSEGIWVIDAESRTTYANQRMAELLGSTPQDMLGGYPNDFLFAEDLETARQTFRLKRQGDDLPFDFRLRRADGSGIWVRVANRPLYGDDGQFVGVLGMFSDITERKKLLEALQEADRRKDEFLAMLAHELRSPLAAIRNAAQAWQLLDAADPRLQWVAEVINRQVQHLSRLVDDLLDVSRITRGKVTLQMESVELAESVARAVETVRPLIETRQQKLAISLPPEPLQLEADPTRLAQVLGNLLVNAIRYTDEGGHIWLTAEAEPTEVVLRVRDTGIGIPAELLPHVFELFTQGKGSPTRSDTGLGIGLTLVKRLVEMHGGSVSALSAGPGKGSEFVVRLPLRQASSSVPVVRTREEGNE